MPVENGTAHLRLWQERKDVDVVEVKVETKIEMNYQGANLMPIYFRRRIVGQTRGRSMGLKLHSFDFVL